MCHTLNYLPDDQERFSYEDWPVNLHCKNMRMVVVNECESCLRARVWTALDYQNVIAYAMFLKKASFVELMVGDGTHTGYEIRDMVDEKAMVYAAMTDVKLATCSKRLQSHAWYTGVALEFPIEEKAIVMAVAECNLEVVKWLHEHGYRILEKYLRWIGHDPDPHPDHMKLLRYLFEHDIYSCDNNSCRGM